jgi:hypothetical protein
LGNFARTKHAILGLEVITQINDIIPIQISEQEHRARLRKSDEPCLRIGTTLLLDAAAYNAQTIG